jgi:hypothetical protein
MAEEPAEAVANAAHTSPLFRHGTDRLWRSGDITNGPVNVELAVAIQCLLPVRLAEPEFNTRREALKQIEHNHHITFFGKMLRDFPHVCVHAENLLHQKQNRPLPAGRARHIRAKFTPSEVPMVSISQPCLPPFCSSPPTRVLGANFAAVT